jgi:hypothetical protein
MAFLRRHIVACTVVGFALLALLVYGRSLGNGFVEWDDGLLIVQNPIVQGLSLHHFTQAFTSYDPELYIPLTFLSYQLNYFVGGLHPFVYHATNLLLHIFNALLVAAILGRLGKSKVAGVAAGLLFLVHPLHTEAVAWAAARKDVLSAFFVLLSLLAYLRYENGESKRMYGWSLVAFLCALLSKVSVLTMPVALLLVDWYRHRAFSRSLIIDKIPYFLMSAAFGVIALLGKIGNGSFLVEKFLIACKATAFYLQKLFVPTGFSVLYPYTKPITFTSPDLLLSFIVVCAVSALVLVLLWRRGWREPLFGWVFFLLFLLPTFNTIAKGQNELLDVYFASDRYAYVASVGILFLAGFLFERLWRKFGGHAWGVLAVILIALSLLAYRQSTVWRDNHTLFTQVLHAYSNSYVAHVNVGAYLMSRGKEDEALDEFVKALDIRGDATAYYNVGVIFEHKGMSAVAEEAFRESLASSPLQEDAYLRLAELLHAQGRTEEAKAVLRQAQEEIPKSSNITQALQQLK